MNEMKSYFSINNTDIYSWIKVNLGLTLSYLTVQIIFKIIKKYLKRKNHNDLKQSAVKYLLERNLKIESFLSSYKNQITKDDIVKICNSSITELTEKIKMKEVSAKKLFLCYALNCCTVARQLNTIADIDFERGLKLAEEADKLISLTKEEDMDKLPILLGIPISIKDHIPAKGYIDTFGLLSNVNLRANKSSLLVKTLENLGAIVLCKSNVPQLLMCAESSNNVFGECKNIWDLTRVTGGSSGGEAGLVQSFCSPIGIGTDCGGSIRNPCHYSGVCGFKPTSNRLGTIDFLNEKGKGDFFLQEWPISTGIIARKLDDIIFLSECLFGKLNDNMYSCYLDSRKFTSSMLNSLYSNQVINVGYYHSYSDIECLVDIKNSIDSEVFKLSNTKKYSVKEIDLSIFEDLYYQGFKILFSSAQLSMIDALKGEKLYYYYNFINELFTGSSMFKKLKLFYLKNILGEIRYAKFVER